MGYNIQYGQTIHKIQIHEHPMRQKNRVLPILLLLGCFIAIYMIYDCRDALRNFLLPGNPNVTESALGALAENLREGESFGNAVAAFCREIIDHANIPK